MRKVLKVNQITIRELRRCATSEAIAKWLKDGDVEIVADGVVIAKLASATSCKANSRSATSYRPYSKEMQAGK